MRKSTLIWLILAIVCGGVLFHTSQKVTDGRQDIARLEHKIAQEQESLRVLAAEWSYLNKPDRLEKLAREHLKLEPMKGRQFIKAADLDQLIPPPAPVVKAENAAPAVINNAEKNAASAAMNNAASAAMNNAAVAAVPPSLPGEAVLESSIPEPGAVSASAR